LKRLSVGDRAPGFILTNHAGKEYQLSEQYCLKNLLLVFNLGLF